MNFAQLRMNFASTSYELRLNFVRTSPQFRTNFAQLCTNFASTSYEFRLNFARTSPRLRKNYCTSSGEVCEERTSHGSIISAPTVIAQWQCNIAILRRGKYHLTLITVESPLKLLQYKCLIGIYSVINTSGQISSRNFRCHFPKSMLAF